MRRIFPWFRKAALSVAALTTTIAPAAAQDHVGQYSQADINFGMRVYGETCVACHGPNGDGVDGVNFRTGRFRSASSDLDLMGIIRAGIPDTAMPPGDYTSPELTGLVAYLRNIGDFDASDVTIGNAERGQTVYEGKGACAQCHRIGVQGSRVAPNLTSIGAIRTAGSLAESLTNPTASMLPVNRNVRAVNQEGTLFTGRRLNEDTYTVQLIDQAERLVSLVKADLREFTILTTSAMPSYEETLSEQERADVLAYLLSLKGTN